MKTTVLPKALLIVCMMIFSSGLAAYAVKPVKATTASALENILSNNIQYPEITFDEYCTGVVDVIFKIDDNDQIDIRKIIADNEDIAACVKKQLSKISFEGIEDHYNKYFKIRITFKLE
ncbi:MAG: hypothetical protein M0P58_07065 [Bacteroidales bacterium]|nr:hypothetical protein [Bacteroidales bacterium]